MQSRLRHPDLVLRSAIGSKLAYSPRVCGVVKDYENAGHMSCIADKYQGAVGSARGGPRALMWRSGTRNAPESSLFVAFRGTVGLRDVADTLDARTARYAFCGTTVRVHAGMLGAFSEMEAELTEAIVGCGERSSVDIPRSLTFAGHSKGGCHAQFAAAYYSSMLAGSCRVTCHTFGAPRVGDGAFAEWYSASVEDSVVMIDRDDPIARLPPEFAGYHGTSELSGTLFVSNVGGAFRCPLECHDMDSYLEHSRALVRTVT